MSDKPARIVHYINQFFGQIGSEKDAGIAPVVRDEPVGPGVALQRLVGESATIVATFICGDNYFNEHVEECSAQIERLLALKGADLVVAGPAFNAGRYGMACGKVCEVASKRAGIPAVTGMAPDNPAVETYRMYGYVVPTDVSARNMKSALEGMSRLILKIAAGVPLGAPGIEGYIARGIRKNVVTDKTGAQRAVDMLVAKMRGLPYTTELPMPRFRKVKPSRPVRDLGKAKVALLTTGGIVPRGNPDRIEACYATKHARYLISEMGGMGLINCETVHGGYDPTFANEDPNRVLPADIMGDLVKEGEIGAVSEVFHVTVGNGMPVTRAESFGKEIAAELAKEGIDAAILTST